MSEQLNDFDKGWEARSEVEQAWRQCHKSIDHPGFVIGFAIISAIAFVSMTIGALSAPSVGEGICVFVFGCFLGMPCFLARSILRDIPNQQAKRDEACKVLQKYRIKGFV